LTPPDKILLSILSRSAHSGLISVPAAGEVLGLSSHDAALKLASLARRGWLRRVRRGLYLILPLETDPRRPVISEDSWVLAREVFAPCYIGGWSAAEHWGLTEQLFRETLVITAVPIRQRSVSLLGHAFRLFQVKPGQAVADASAWRGSERVPVSSAEQTLVDCFQNPWLCGGVRHLAEVMREYGASEQRNMDRLRQTVRRRGKGVVWKRLGFLAEVLWPGEEKMIEEASDNLSTGAIRLDPKVRAKGRLVRRWGLWVNVDVGGKAEDS